MQPTLEDQERHLLVKVIDRRGGPLGARGSEVEREKGEACVCAFTPLGIQALLLCPASLPSAGPCASPFPHTHTPTPTPEPHPPHRVLYKLEDKVRPYVHKILVVIEPLLIDEDYYARVEGREIIANLAKAAGLAQMIAAMRPDIDNVDE